MAGLQRRERRLLVLGGLVAALVLGYIYGVEPLVGRRERVRELIASREELLARQQRLLARAGRYQQEQETLQAEIAARRARLLPGDRAPLAASDLQRLIKSTAQETGVEVRSERILPTTEQQGYTEVSVEVTLSGPIRPLVAFLNRLAAVPALVSIQDVKIRVVSVNDPRDLSTTVTVTGYIAAGGEPDRAGGEPGRRPGA